MRMFYFSATDAWIILMVFSRRNEQSVLRDITDKQNGLRRQRGGTKSPSPSSPTKGATAGDKRRQHKEGSGPLAGSEERLYEPGSDCASPLPTPVHSRNSKEDEGACFPTPPDSTHHSHKEGTMTKSFWQKSNQKFIFECQPKQTNALLVVSKQAYPTPESTSLSRHWPPQYKGRRLSLSTAGTESEPPSSPLRVSALRFRRRLDGAKRVDIMEPQEDIDFVPSSQTQYLHFSPRKQEQASSRPLPPLATLIFDLDPNCVPSSQSQPAVYSPRKLKRPPPLSIKPACLTGAEGVMSVVKPDFVVPTSQEDELEISLLDEDCPSASQFMAVVLRQTPKAGDPSLREYVSDIVAVISLDINHPFQ